MELTHVRLLVDDFEGCFRFYRDGLGLTPQPDAPQGPYVKFALPGGGALSLQARAHFEAHGLPLRPTGDGALLALRVPEVATAVLALRARGLEVTEPRALFGRMTVAWLRDPAGTLLELQTW